GNNAVREVLASTGIITTIMGRPSACSGISGDGGPASNSALCKPLGATFDVAGNLLVTEHAGRVREVTVPMLPPTAATAAPVFDIPAGTYAGPQSVNITDATPGAKIYVTVN